MSLLLPSWTLSSLFRPEESLTRPITGHTSLVPAALSSFSSPRDSCCHIQAHTKAQINPSEIFNHASQLALPPPSFVTLYLLVCLPALLCSLGSSVVAAVSPSFLFLSVHLFSYFHRAPSHQPLSTTRQLHLSPCDCFAFPLFLTR